MKTFWHFVREDRKLGYGDGRFVEPGKTYRLLSGEPVLCANGMHASDRVIDAFKYAPGPWLCEVTLSGDFRRGNDKVVAKERTVVRMADITAILSEFARKEALAVFKKHFNKTKENAVIFKWLKTGDERFKSAAQSAAWSAAWSAVRSAAESAAELTQNKQLMRLINKKAVWLTATK